MTQLKTDTHTGPSPEAAVDKSGGRIRQMFGEIAPRYDFMNHFLSCGVDYYWRWRTVRNLKLKADEPILDVCTGTGDLALAYWKKCARQTPVLATDFTHEMLTLAHNKYDVATEKTLRFFEADTQQLPFPDDRFQIVSVAFGLRNVNDTRAGLKEMLRVCKPGGHVVVLEFSIPSNLLLRGMYHAYFKSILPLMGQLLARNQQSAYNYLPASVAEFPYGEALAEIMRECGMEPVRYKQLTGGIATLYWGQKPV